MIAGSLGAIFLWVLAAIIVALGVGYYLGRTAQQQRGQASAEKERRAAIAALSELLKSVELLTQDMGRHHDQMRAVQSQVNDLHGGEEVEAIRQRLLGYVASVIVSNQRLEDDLVYARCRLHLQTEELDRTRREAATDSLSGVANRRTFDERLQMLLGALKRGGDPFALILADLDHFKWINDTHGHVAGDNVLREFGKLLQELVRDGDIVARYGGDEFAVLLPKIEVDRGLKIADRLRSEATKMNFGLNKIAEEGSVTLSVGVAFARAGDTSETLIERADQSLYAAKRGGRNQVQYCRTDSKVEPLAVAVPAPSTPSDATGSAPSDVPPVVSTAEAVAEATTPADRPLAAPSLAEEAALALVAGTDPLAVLERYGALSTDEIAAAAARLGLLGGSGPAAVASHGSSIAAPTAPVAAEVLVPLPDSSPLGGFSNAPSC